MGDLFAPTFVIVMFVVFFGTALAILLSEILAKLKKIETLINIKQQMKKKSETPLLATDIQVDRFEYGKCPICGNTVWYSDKKCKKCGQKLKWDNEDKSKNNDS